MSSDKNNDKYKDFAWNIFVSAFITFSIFFMYIFIVNVVKKIFSFFTPIINQENLIFLIFLIIFSFVQYLYLVGNIISEESSNKNKFKFIISILFLLSALVLPFFISFLYLKNIYPTFEQFFITDRRYQKKNISWYFWLSYILRNFYICMASVFCTLFYFKNSAIF